MQKCLKLVLVFLSLGHQTVSQDCHDPTDSCLLSVNGTSDSYTKVLSRRRRYLVFPEGASFSMAACLTVGWYGNQYYSYIDWATNWGLSYNLPNETYTQTLRRKAETDMPRSVTSRRFRRDLYRDLEHAMDTLGYNGRECMLKTLCETYQRFGTQGGNMIKEMLRTIFSLPASKVLSFEHPDLKMYEKAYRSGKSRALCRNLFPNCRFSIHEVALGGYTKPPQYMM